MASQRERLCSERCDGWQPFLDLTGYHDRPDPNGHFGGVTQTFPTVAGFDYHVFLDIGVFISTSVPGKSLPGPISVIVGWSGPNGENPSEQTCGPFDATAEGAQWHTCELPFHARTANTTVRIYGALGKHYIGLTRLWCSAWRHWAGIFSVLIGFSDSEPPNSRWDRSRSSGHRGDPRRRRSLHASNHGEIGGQKQTYLACVMPMPSTRFAPVKES